MTSVASETSPNPDPSTPTERFAASVVVLSGNPRPGSRTTAFASVVARAVARELLAGEGTVSVGVIDLAALPAAQSSAARPSQLRADAPTVSVGVIDLAALPADQSSAARPSQLRADAPTVSVGVIDLAALPADQSSAARPSQLRADALAAVRGAKVLVVASPTYKASYTGLLKSFLDELPPAALSGVVAIPLMTAGAPGHSLAADVHLRPVLLELGAWTPTAAVVALEPDLADPEPLVAGWLLRNGPVLRALAGAQLIST